MDPSLWSRGMHSSSSFCTDGFPARHVSSFQLDTVRLKSAVSGLPESVHKDREDIQMPPQRAHVTPNTTAHLPATKHSPPASGSCGHQAKRARVEHIIRGMSGSPGVRRDQDEMASRHQEQGGVRGNERMGPGGQVTGEQPENQHQHLRQLRTRLSRAGGRPVWNRGPESSSKEVELINCFQSKPERIKLMADVLKYELSRAVSRSVDSLFKKSAPLLQTSANEGRGVETDACRRPPVGKDELHEGPDLQTEALCLVVQKPPRGAEPPVPVGPALRKGQAPGESLGCTREACCGGTRAKCETFDARWRSVKVRSKVNSRSDGSPERRAVSTGHVLLESPKADVKMESDDPRKSSLYVLNEGLTTNHLKKAKHMFFYTRYPSSLVLKTCFYDVQFTRCIASQLIKWFSNFREFYYIQMEKFARHALAAVADARSLAVGRESDLFRALNAHYNKTNDFQVPDGFLEVAEITLREFYVAISMGKDRDPSWKKPIYKVICKLDSDVAAEFKSHPSG